MNLGQEINRCCGVLWETLWFLLGGVIVFGSIWLLAIIADLPVDFMDLDSESVWLKKSFIIAIIAGALLIVFIAPDALDNTTRVIVNVPEKLIEWLSPTVRSSLSYHHWVTGVMRALGMGGFIACALMLVSLPQQDGKTNEEVTTVSDVLGEVGPDLLGGVSFADNSSEIQESSLDALEMHLTVLGTNHDLTYVVAGHADARGPDGYNLDLSERRTQAVIDWLVDSGIDRAQLIGVGHGENCAARFGGMNVDQFNRRVFIRPLEPD